VADLGPSAVAPKPVTKPTAKPKTKATIKPKPKATAKATVKPKPKPKAVRYANCAAARAAGAAPLHRGDPGYSSRLDRDGDGVACE